MIADGIKLTSYFGERDRVNGAFVADALLDLYCRHDIAASIMLRGIRGSGLKHHLRTNSSLSLSGNLPLTAIAVDARPTIEAVLNQTLELNQSGLVTIERARLLSGKIEPVGIEDNAGEATKLTCYLSRRDSVYMVPAFEEICDLLYRRGIPGAIALLGVDGIAHGRRQRTRFLSRNANLPMMVVAVGPAGRIGMMLPELAGLLRHPLMTLERVRICKRDGQLIDIPEPAVEADDRGFPLWQKLTVYTPEAARHNGRPIHRVDVRRLRLAGISGATTHRGFWGFHGERPPHGDRFLRLGQHVPMVMTVIDTAERIIAAFAVIDELTKEQGLVTSETVPGIRAISGHQQPGKL